MLTHAAFWQALLESLYDGLLALDTATYRTQDSDAWTQRTDMRREWVPKHLAASFELGPVPRIGPDYLGDFTQGARLTFASRYRPTNDSESQAMQAAATWAAAEYLLDWSYAGCRIDTITPTPQARDEQFNTVSLDLTISIPRG